MYTLRTFGADANKKDIEQCWLQSCKHTIPSKMCFSIRSVISLSRKSEPVFIRLCDRKVKRYE